MAAKAKQDGGSTETWELRLKRFVERAVAHPDEGHHIHIDDLVGSKDWRQMAVAVDPVLCAAQEILCRKNAWDVVAVVVYWCNGYLSHRIGAKKITRSFYDKYTPPELAVMSVATFRRGYHPLCGLSLATIVPCPTGVRRTVYEGRALGDPTGSETRRDVFTVAIM